MVEVWNRELPGVVVTVAVEETVLKRGDRFTAVLAAYAGGLVSRFALSWPRATPREAYEDLLQSYAEGEHLIGSGLRRLGVSPRYFPPCSSAEELELKLAVAEGRSR